jgi:Glycine/sarcosine/betaine reductase selenoprotein B (GRDB)
VRVDSFKFLPRSFRPLYEDPERLPGEDQPVWAPAGKRLTEARVTLLTSAGLYLAGEQAPFDLERERREPAWGDPGWRRLPHAVPEGGLAMAHLHVNPADVLADRNVALPVDVLDELAAAGVVGGATPEHVSVMGYQEHGLAGWRNATAPAIVELLRAQGTDAVVLAPV